MPPIQSLPRSAARLSVSLPAPTRQRSNNQVLQVAMNAEGSWEAQAQRDRGVKVVLVAPSRVADTVYTRDAQGKVVTHDLTTLEGCRGFVQTFKLGAAQTEKIASAICRSQPDSRDELAQLAAVWARAERGEEVPSRLLLSGHSAGSGVWGDNNGQLKFTALAELAAAMPAAARTVEDLHLSACYNGSQKNMELYRAMFPNVKTIWAYTGSAPGSWTGAMPHQALWEKATRGEVESLQRAVAEGTRKGQNVAVWSKTLGYLSGSPASPLESVRHDLATASPAFDAASSGSAPVVDPQTGPLRDYYNQVQRLLQHPELPAAERPAVEASRDRTIRLLYYSATVAPAFQAKHAAAIAAGYAAVGMTAPDFSVLSRQDALTQIQLFETKVAQQRPVPAAGLSLLPLVRGLRSLSSETLPEGWI